MRRELAYLFCGLMASTAAAQKVTLEISPKKDKTLRYTIQTTSEMETKREMTIDGEEMGGRFGGRGGGGGGPTTTKQKLVFDEGPAKSGWRNYITATAEVTRPDRDGEDQTTEVEGALNGKKILIQTKDGKTVFTEKTEGKAEAEGDAESKPEALPQQVTNGVPASIDLTGLVSKDPVEVDGKFDISKGFIAALKNLMHPVRAARTPRGGRDRGGEGGGRRGGGRRGGGRGEQGDRGDRGDRRGGFRGMRRAPNTFNSTAVRILGSKKLDCKAEGKLLAIEEKDGVKFARLSIEAEITGKGTPTELGMGNTRGGRGFGGGRGGRGGEGRGGQRGGGENREDTGKAKVSMKVTGTLVINQTTGTVQQLKLKGTFDSASESVRTMGRGGEDRELEIKQSTKGTFGVTVGCEPRTAKKSD